MEIKHKGLGLDLVIDFDNEAAVKFETNLLALNDSEAEVTAREYWAQIVQIAIDAGAIPVSVLGEGVTRASKARPNLVQYLAEKASKAYREATEITPE